MNMKKTKEINLLKKRFAIINSLYTKLFLSKDYEKNIYNIFTFINWLLF